MHPAVALRLSAFDLIVILNETQSLIATCKVMLDLAGG